MDTLYTTEVEATLVSLHDAFRNLYPKNFGNSGAIGRLLTFLSGGQRCCVCQKALNSLKVYTSTYSFVPDGKSSDGPSREETKFKVHDTRFHMKMIYVSKFRL